MRKFRSHKIVEAERVIGTDEAPDGQRVVCVESVSGGFDMIPVPSNFFARGTPAVGDYLVRYEDGYLSWSPKKAFEDGYVAVE